MSKKIKNAKKEQLDILPPTSRQRVVVPHVPTNKRGKHIRREASINNSVDRIRVVRKKPLSVDLECRVNKNFRSKTKRLNIQLPYREAVKERLRHKYVKNGKVDEDALEKAAENWEAEYVQKQIARLCGLTGAAQPVAKAKIPSVIKFEEDKK